MTSAGGSGWACALRVESSCTHANLICVCSVISSATQPHNFFARPFSFLASRFTCSCFSPHSLSIGHAIGGFSDNFRLCTWLRVFWETGSGDVQKYRLIPKCEKKIGRDELQSAQKNSSKQGIIGITERGYRKLTFSHVRQAQRCVRCTF